MRNCWIVFHWQPPRPGDGYKDELIPCVAGVFNDQKLAEDNCLDDMHYIFPMTMNEPIHGDPKDHAEAYYPKSREATNGTPDRPLQEPSA